MITKEQLVQMIRDFTADQRADASHHDFPTLSKAVDLIDTARSEFHWDSSEMRLLMFYADVFGTDLHDRCGGLSNSYQPDEPTKPINLDITELFRERSWRISKRDHAEYRCTIWFKSGSSILAAEGTGTTARCAIEASLKRLQLMRERHSTP